MAIREVDVISNAIIETEREIAGAAWDQEETERDETGERSLEEMGEGLEGQHEAKDDEELEAEEAEGETESEAEGEADETAEALAAADKGKGEPEPKPGPETGRVPAGRLREANDRARAAEAERDTVKTQLESFSDKLEQAMRRIDDLSRAPRAEAPKPGEPDKPEPIPDLFEDPKGFAEHLQRGFQNELLKRDQQLAAQRVETSMAIAHASQKDAFEKAWGAVSKLNPNDPDGRATVQRIYASPNPGEALLNWHKRNETLARVGDDPAKFEERIRDETRQALLKDPEFRKQLIADLRGEAAAGDDGTARTTTRLPRSLARASGSNLGAERRGASDDDSEQALADSAWR